MSRISDTELEGWTGNGYQPAQCKSSCGLDQGSLRQRSDKITACYCILCPVAIFNRPLHCGATKREFHLVLKPNKPPLLSYLCLKLAVSWTIVGITHNLSLQNNFSMVTEFDRPPQGRQKSFASEYIPSRNRMQARRCEALHRRIAPSSITFSCASLLY